MAAVIILGYRPSSAFYLVTEPTINAADESLTYIVPFSHFDLARLHRPNPASAT